MNAPLGNSLALVLSYRKVPFWLSPHLEPIISRQTYINTLAGMYLSLGIFEKIFFELGIHELFVKVSLAVCGEHLGEHLRLYKKEYNGIVHLQPGSHILQSHRSYVHLQPGSHIYQSLHSIVGHS